MDTPELPWCLVDEPSGSASPHSQGIAVDLVQRPGSNPTALPVRRDSDEYLARYVEPVKTLRSALTEILDVEGNPERSPEEALGQVREAMDSFAAETDDWFC